MSVSIILFQFECLMGKMGPHSEASINFNFFSVFLLFSFFLKLQFVRHRRIQNVASKSIVFKTTHTHSLICTISKLMNDD